MNFNHFSGSGRMKQVLLVAALAAFSFAFAACTQEEATAQTPAPTTNESGIDPAVLNLFLESRIQRPADQATIEERDAVTKEIMDIYRVTDLPEAIALGNEPTTRAQIELQRRALLFNAFANDFLTKNQATEEEILSTYEKEVGASPPIEYKARHILVETQSEAMSLVEELNGGADFEELAKSKSTGPSGPSGGDLGWFTAQAMVKPFSDAVVAMEDGSFSNEPVQSQFGWHVILREGSRESAPPPMESVRDVIKQRIEQEKLQVFIESLR